MKGWQFQVSWLILCAVPFAPVRAVNAQEASLPPGGVIRQVTLYRGQALVTREVPVPAVAGLQTLRIENLPERLVRGSLYAEGNERVAVRAVRETERVIDQSEREDVRELDQKIEESNQSATASARQVDVVQQNIAQLNQVLNFSVNAAHGDLSRGVLNGETLTQLTKFGMDQRAELATELLKWETQVTEQSRELERLSRERSLLTSQTPAAAHAAELSVESQGTAGATIKLSYLVSDCNWTPQYTLKARGGQADFELQYTALVQQITGEVWDRVQMTLSTASPSISAAGPSLAPFRITASDQADDLFGAGEQSAPTNNSANNQPGGGPYGGGGYGGYGSSSSLADQAKSLRKQQAAAEMQRSAQAQSTAPEQRDQPLNELAQQLQQLELLADARVAKGLNADQQEDVASQVYQLSQPVSLDSRRDQQLVEVIHAQLAGQLYHVATPLLSTYVYREAEMINTQPVGLLRGSANVYLDDRFVGRAELPTTASGQRMVVGFGADPQVRTRRELLDKQDLYQGGNRRLRFQYRLVLANFKKQSVQVRLMDRMPLAQNPQEVSIQLEEPPGGAWKLSDDGLYRRLQLPRGILRWDLEVPAERFGSEALDIDYVYTIEFDRNRSLAGVEDARQQEIDASAINAPAAETGGGAMGGLGGGLGESP